MRLTPDILIGAYEYLRTTPPFKGWRLLHADQIEFRVTAGPDHFGWHEQSGDRHIIAVSAKTHSHSASLIITMAHEMIHLHQGIKRLWTRGVDHNEDFLRRAERVCRVHGFDPAVF